MYLVVCQYHRSLILLEDLCIVRQYPVLVFKLLYSIIKAMEEDDFAEKLAINKTLIHYYGDIVRACFVASGFVLLVAILLDKQLLQIYLAIGVLGVLLLIILAGLTSPRKEWVLFIESIVAGVGFLFFEYVAVAAYLHSGTMTDIVFILRQTLSILFLVTLYYSVKSIRGAHE